MIKRTKKTIIPYIFWSLFGFGFGIWMNTLRWEDVTIKYVVNGLINGSLVRIFWLFIPLYIVYLSIPLFSAVEEERRKSVFVYISVVGFLLNVLIPFLAGFTY